VAPILPPPFFSYIKTGKKILIVKSNSSGGFNLYWIAKLSTENSYPQVAKLLLVFLLCDFGGLSKMDNIGQK